MEIEKLSGTEERLYQLVGPLVMDPAVLRQNNNYPFKTSVHHIWFVAVEEDLVLGFMPVEVKNDQAVINNYYIADENPGFLIAMLKSVLGYFGKEYRVQAVVQMRDIDVFKKHKFEVIRTWKVYVRMELRRRKPKN
jgi:hypothetical protein